MQNARRAHTERHANTHQFENGQSPHYWKRQLKWQRQENTLAINIFFHLNIFHEIPALVTKGANYVHASRSFNLADMTHIYWKGEHKNKSTQMYFSLSTVLIQQFFFFFFVIWSKSFSKYPWKIKLDTTDSEGNVQTKAYKLFYTCLIQQLQSGPALYLWSLSHTRPTWRSRLFLKGTQKATFMFSYLLC